MEQKIIIPSEETSVKSRLVPYCFAVLLLLSVYLHFSGLIRTSGNISYLIRMIGDAALFISTLVIALLSGAKLNPSAIVFFVSGLVAASSGWINGGYFDTVALYFFVLVLSYCLFVLALFENHSGSISGLAVFFDAAKAALFYPVLSFGAIFKLFFQRRKTRSKQVGRKILYTVIGIAAAVILGIVVISMLSYDPNFEKLFRIEWKWDDLPIILLRILLTVPVGALVFGAFCSSKEKKLPELSTKEKRSALTERLKCVPLIIFAIPSVTLLVIYGLFFFTQWDVYMSAFSGVLPSSYTYAEYARSGFFELCVVAFINAAFSAAFRMLAKEMSRASGLVRRIANTLLALATLILIATALSKMILYIKSYDLTVLRLFTSIVMILIGIGFLVSLLAQWVRRIKVFPVLFLLAAVLILVAPFLNVRGRIAQYNVNAYIARDELCIEPNKIDLFYLTFELDDAGIPDAIRLLESGTLAESDVKDLYGILEERYQSLKELEPHCHTLASRRALKALEDFFNQI